MKKIINNKLYDTNTAKLLAENRSDVGQNDFRFFEEELYVNNPPLNGQLKI